MTRVLPRKPEPQSLAELLVRAQALAGHTVAEIALALGAAVPSESRRAKGFVGELIEAALGASPLAGDGPDFPHLGVELKTLPLTAAQRPKESTFCCSIHLTDAVQEQWLSSRLRRRLAQVLWVPVVAPRTLAIGARRVAQPFLWRPNAAEEAQLAADWEDLMGKIATGAPPTAHEGVLLQVRPKAADSRMRAWQVDDEGPARVLPLGLYLRARFTATLLANAATRG